MKFYLFIMTLFFCSIGIAQGTISGTVKDNKGLPVAGATVKIVGDTDGTSTDYDGNFSVKTSKKGNVALVVSSVGFGSKTATAKAGDNNVSIALSAEDTALDEIVVSASRTPERVRESGVTIERMTMKDIKKTASPSFYDGLENMKEVHMNTSSLTFKSINTRGFATVANTRFMQLVDGMDNSSPLLNFPLGNLVGLSEIDVQSVELLPGASSALYGANAFNGILFMNSQSPFEKEGVTASLKYGQTSQKAAGTNDFYDVSVRAAKAFSKHFAAKANFNFMRGTDWYANDQSDLANPGADRSFHNYNGLNVYGDEASTNLRNVGASLADLGLISQSQASALPNYNVSRTGYLETDLTNNRASNSKFDVSLNLKPWANDFEIIFRSKLGYGNTVYQGGNRYYLNNFMMSQQGLEVKGKSFFVRGYTTTEDGGNSYDMLFTGLNINRQWKPDATWFGQYAGAFLAAQTQGQSVTQAHAAARSVADTGRFLPGTPEFRAAFAKVTSEADVRTGSKLVDNSRIWHSDANYNFKDEVKFAEIQVGGSYRLFSLDSQGRIYTDKDSPITYNEYGAYTQIQKKLMDDKLKLTGSVRYDKAQNFEGNFSPRISAVYSIGERKQHNIRASFQTGFRNPSTQDQYIGFNVGSAVLVGSAPDNLERYRETLPVSVAGQAFAGGTTATVTGTNAYFNSYTAQSVAAFGAAASSQGVVAAAALLVKTNVNLVQPETVKAIELGFRGDVKGFNYDLNGYYNTYNNFIGNLNVVAPLYGAATNGAGGNFTAPNTAWQSARALTLGDRRVFQLYTNTKPEITSLGFGAALSRRLNKTFELSANYNYAEFQYDQALDPSFEAGFNTPRHRAKGSLSGENLFGTTIGFNLSGRWNSCYLYQSNFADGIIDEATVIDAQINVGVPKLKSIFKIGAANLGMKEYRQIVGAGLIGTQVFASWTITP
ncbi:MAG: hypothetical protein RLZZ312_1777 [Bacteroidota bacterium]|jgi:outer membrane cobalamin receptor